LGSLATGVGINVLSGMLERVARGEDIPNDEIRKTMEDVIKGSGIEDLDNEFWRATGRIVRKLDLIKFAVHEGEYNIATTLKEQYAQHAVILEDINEKLDLLLNQSKETYAPVSFSHPKFPTAIVDQKIINEVTYLRRSRFFREFDRKNYSLRLASRLIDGELSGGTNEIRSYALAWCSRVLSRIEIEKAEEYYKLANELGSGAEINIAAAFINSQKGDKDSALNDLAKIDTPVSRGAAFMVFEHHDGPEKAIGWLSTVSITLNDLDPDGKLVLLMRQLDLARWDEAYESLNALTKEDMHEAPVLNHVIAITHLLRSVPTELRSVVLSQLPFEGANFPLASDEAAISARRVAHNHFVNSVKVAQELNCPSAATIDDEYALWLELMDSDESDNGRKRLETKLRDPKSALRLVHLALQFGINLNLEAVELEIERQIALHGELTQDAAIARFALAFTQKTPEDVANYVAHHSTELSKYFDKKALQFLQIEMLSRAGLPEKANSYLEKFAKDSLTDMEVDRLRSIIAEAEGIDSIESRMEQFKATDSLADLASLVNELETRADWSGVCEYGQILFERTRSLRDAERLANSLNITLKYKNLVEFLAEKETYRAQSKSLQLLYCWSLYYEGKILESRTELSRLNEDREDSNYRALQWNLGIALGDWASLSAFVAEECQKKDERSAQELIIAAELALILESPRCEGIGIFCSG